MENNTSVPQPQATQYTNAQWEALCEATFARLRGLAASKGAEYSGQEDRLANFRRNGQALGLLPEVVWAVYAGKHWDALQIYIRDLASGQERERSEPIDSRVDDLLVYLLLFKAILEERAARPAVALTMLTGNIHITDIVYCQFCGKRVFSGMSHHCLHAHSLDLSGRTEE